MNKDILVPNDILNSGLNTNNATYVDINPTFDVNMSPAVLLTDTYAIVYGSIANLLACPPGGRGRIFQEDYWSSLYQLLQEPFDSQTSNFIELAVQQVISTWEPRITNVFVSTTIDTSIPGYIINVRGELLSNPKQPFKASYALATVSTQQ
jgi:phage baseplate assembly protein W